MDCEAYKVPTELLPQQKNEGPTKDDKSLISAATLPLGASPEVEVIIENDVYWIHSALTVEEQIEVFGDILERTKNVDNTQKRPCMNPSPKTLIFNGQKSTLSFVKKQENQDESKNFSTKSYPSSVYDDLILHRATSLASHHIDRKSRMVGVESRLDYNRYSVGVIRYAAPNGRFPEHIDHCNVRNGWVFLLSLGCKARFSVQKVVPRSSTTNAAMKEKKKTGKILLELNSGDVLIFDPSSEAAILHGVTSIIPCTCPEALIQAFGEEAVSNHRYGIQCRTSLEE